MTHLADLHHEAMSLNDEAMSARSSGDSARSLSLVRRAFEREKQAAGLVVDDLQFEPTRSVLHRSAASLAIDCGEYREAERLIAVALSGDPPEEIAEELRDLLEDVNFGRHLALRGQELSSRELQLSIAGNAVAYGLAESDEFISRVQTAEKLLSRTFERKRGLAFRESGRPPEEIARSCTLYVSAPHPGSLAVMLRVGVPQRQMNLPSMEGDVVEPERLIAEVLDCLETLGSGGAEALKPLIPDQAYRRNFVALAERLAPDGNRVKLVGLTSLAGGIERQVALRQPPVKERSHPANGQVSIVEVTGTLRFASSVSDRTPVIKVIDDQGKEHRFKVPKGLMADIIKPYWEERVEVKGEVRGKKIILVDIHEAMADAAS